MLRQKSIKITDGKTATIFLLAGIEFEIEQRRICKKQTMASGLTVIDIIGYKNILKIPTGWLPSAELEALIFMIKVNPCLTVTYPYLGGWREDTFIFELPMLKSFKYDDNGAEYLGVTLEAEQASAEAILKSEIGGEISTNSGTPLSGNQNDGEGG